MIRILQSVSNMDRGGIETMLMNFYRNVDRDLVQFDFLANKPDPGDYDDEIKEMGGRIFITPGYKSYKNYMSYMSGLFKDHPEYKIIHTHNGSLMFYALKSAKNNNIPIRIAHAHSSAIPLGLKNEFKKLIKPMIKLVATDYWGCSDASGKFYFTEKRWNERHELIHNAINVDNFTFNEDHRAAIRRRYNLGDKLVLGHVGRLSPEKNQATIIDIFSELHKINQNSHLVIVGTGELDGSLKQHAADLGLQNDITFTGVQTNVNEWYSAFDVFIMASIHEGLPVVAVEAQAADLPCVLCNTITPEVKVTDNVKFLGLKDTPAKWAKTVLELKPGSRVSRLTDLQKSGYDIKTEAKRMQDLYIDLYSRLKEK